MSTNAFSSNAITRISMIMAAAQIINFLVCMEPVWPRQQAVQCDGCYGWSHRICNTATFSACQFPRLHFFSNVDFWIDLVSILQEVYQAAVRDGSDSEWWCMLGKHPNAEGTMEPIKNVSLPDAESTQVEDMSYKRAWTISTWYWEDPGLGYVSRWAWQHKRILTAGLSACRVVLLPWCSLSCQAKRRRIIAR